MKYRNRFAMALMLAVVGAVVITGAAAAKPKIMDITGTANTSWTTSGGKGALVVNGTAGLWTGGFGSEPSGNDVLAVTMKVNGEGGVSLNYQIQTTDIAFFDWLDITLTTSSGTVPIVSGYNPNPSLSSYLSPVNPLSVDLTPYKGQTVTLNISAHQDGFGDQFQALITGLTTFGLD